MFSSRLRWYWYRIVQILRSASCTLIYSLRNRFSSAPVTGAEGPIVSLTSHGVRIETVHLTIESIGAGDRRPRRLLLFLDDHKAITNLPRSLVRLQIRGLEVLPADNFGPHTKYYPFVSSRSDVVSPLVTADDDMLYSASWLDDLYSAYIRNPSVISCHRARVICLTDEGLRPFRTWPFVTSDGPEPLNFLEGVSGVIYPPEFLHCLRQFGNRFLLCCPKHDDAWLNAVAIKSGFPRVQLSPNARSYSEILGTIASGLWKHNQGPSGEVQLERAFAEVGVSFLLQPKPQANDSTRVDESLC